MIPLTATWNGLAENAYFVVTVPLCWLFSRQAHLAAWRGTIPLFHSPDPTVIPYIQGIQWLRGQKQLFPMRAVSSRWTERETKDTDRGILKAFFFEKIENFSCLHLDQCLCLCWAVQRQTIRCNFILLHQLLHIPSQTAPLSRRFVRAPQWRDADRLSCLNGFSRAAERPAQQ